MSKQALDKLDKARKELLEAQRRCAWCAQEFKSVNDLVEHILVTHKGAEPEYAKRVAAAGMPS